MSQYRCTHGRGGAVGTSAASPPGARQPQRGPCWSHPLRPQWGSNMVHPSQTGLRQPSDHRSGNWRDVVGLLIALIGFALVIGAITLTI